VINGVVHAKTVAADRCPIPIVAYAAESDNIVTPMSASSVFPNSGVLPGDHFSIIRPDGSKHRTVLALKRELGLALDEPFPLPAAPPPTAIEPWWTRNIETELRSYDPLYVDLGGSQPVQFVVHAGPIEQISNVDILVSSENVYFQMAQAFKPSISGRLRRAAAIKGAAGEIIEDVAADELVEWMRQHARYGLPVEAGTVASTSSGALAERGVKRIYHAATAIPKHAMPDYDVTSHGVTRAIHNVFSVGRRERSSLNLRLDSVCFPLLGSGRGGLSAETSFDWIWRAMRKELEADDSWVINFVVWRTEDANMLLHALSSWGGDERRGA